MTIEKADYKQPCRSRKLTLGTKHGPSQLEEGLIKGTYNFSYVDRDIKEEMVSFR